MCCELAPEDVGVDDANRGSMKLLCEFDDARVLVLVCRRSKVCCELAPEDVVVRRKQREQKLSDALCRFLVLCSSPRRGVACIGSGTYLVRLEESKFPSEV